MSYYRPATAPCNSEHDHHHHHHAASPPPAVTVTLEAVQEEEQPAPVPETAFSPSATVQPLPMQSHHSVQKTRPIATGAGRLQPPATDVECLQWCSVFCAVRPLGTCARLQRVDTMYCEVHSCSVEYPDGTRCANPVKNPRDSRVCLIGYHVENNRQGILLDMINRRMDHKMREAEEAEESHRAALQYFDENFPFIPKDPPEVDTRSAGSTASGNGSRKGSSGGRSWTGAADGTGERRRPSPTEFVLGYGFGWCPPERWMSAGWKSPCASPYRPLKAE